jgi:uncharacterized membrane protein
MEKERGVERLIFFTDAVAAIAITLLILPLVEIVAADSSKNKLVPVATFIGENFSQLLAFGLSFLIIARFWMANHEILQNTVRVTQLVMWIDIAWVFTIVILPLPTEITAVYPPSVLIVSIYIGTCLVSTLLLTALAVYLNRHPELESKDRPLSATQVWGIGSTAVGFVIALILSLAIPAIHYYSLLVLLLSFPLDAIMKPRIRRREAERSRT